MIPLFAANIYWDLPVLLITFSLVYSATRHDRWDRILIESVGWIIRVTVFLTTIGGGLFILSNYPDRWKQLAVAIAVVVFSVMYLPGYWQKWKQKRKSAETKQEKPATS